MSKTKYSWVPFYEELADKLLSFKSNRSELVEKVKEAYQIERLDLPKVEDDNAIVPDIDPFTVFGLFNRSGKGTVIDSRPKVCDGYKKVFGMSSDVPSDFEGVPLHFPMGYCFYAYIGDPKRDNNCFDSLWNLFEQAIIYSNDKSNVTEFEAAFEQALNLPRIALAKLTMGLFHIRPRMFLNLDSNNKALLKSELGKTVKKLSGDDYLSLCSEVSAYAKANLHGSFPEFSSMAYEQKKSAKVKKEDWIPALEQYDPKLTKDEWLRFMQESSRFNDSYKLLLAGMYHMGGQATCKQLGREYGKTANSFNLTAVRFAEEVQKFTQCPIWIDEDGNKRYWSIPFFGKNATTEDGKFVWKLRPALQEAIEEYGLATHPQDESPNKPEKKEVKTMISKNTILCGPPGTGKTYSSAIYAVAIIEGGEVEALEAEPYSEIMKRYKNYKEQGRIEFTTFHQSYGYEEFIEGIRPILDEDSEEDEKPEYRVVPGLFKSFCEKASLPAIKSNAGIGLNPNPTVWKVSLEGTGDNQTREECMKNNHIRIGYDSYGENITDETVVSSGKKVLTAFISRMRIGDIVFSCYSATEIDAIGVITGDYEWHDEYKKYKRLRKVKWLAKGIKEDITSINAGKIMTLPSAYALNSITPSDAMELLARVAPKDTKIEEQERQNYVFIIDEINRGNISKIFGELITLIEPSKRLGQSEGMTAKLPYSMKPFGVPDNVYILGTMNTADRSIAMLDTALRRRFHFKEMQPKPDLLDFKIGSLDIGKMLDRMNRKISVLYDREHTIGHAYFIPLGEIDEKERSVKDLAEIFQSRIIPLLQEYFYDDYEKIRLVLGDNQKDNEELQFIIARANDYADLFGDSSADFDESITYEINSKALMNIEAYKLI